MSDDLSLYLKGGALYGDDFDDEALQRWYQEEERGYFDLSDSQGGHQATLRAYDELHFYPHLAGKKDLKLLGLGGADGTDYESIAPQIADFTIIEIAEDFWCNEIYGRPATYLKPALRGDIDRPDDTFDVVTSFSVLHHIPNVSQILRELFRVLKPGGLLLYREPIVSMGDWRNPRVGLTANERGIPLSYLDRCVAEIGFRSLYRAPSGFPPLARLLRKMGVECPLNHAPVARLDHWLSRLFTFNLRYHHTSVFHRFAPAGVAMVLEKPGV